MSKVLITGASGFTGSYLLSFLKAEGYHVVAISNHSTLAHETYSCDLRDKSGISKTVDSIKPDHVVHLAAFSFAGSDNVQSFYDVNLFGTLNLLESLSDLDNIPEKVIIASSANIYGANAQYTIDESICPAPVNHYASSKLVMEHMARTWFDRIPIILTRPFNYTGVGQDSHFLIPKIVNHFRQGVSTIQLGNTSISRDFTDVRDVIQAYALLLKSDAYSQTVNISSGRAVSLDWILQYMQDLAGYEITIQQDPSLMRSSEISCLHGDNTRLRQLIDFTPSISMEETLNWMYSAT